MKRFLLIAVLLVAAPAVAWEACPVELVEAMSGQVAATQALMDRVEEGGCHMEGNAIRLTVPDFGNSPQYADISCSGSCPDEKLHTCDDQPSCFIGTDPSGQHATGYGGACVYSTANGPCELCDYYCGPYGDVCCASHTSAPCDICKAVSFFYKGQLMDVLVADEDPPTFP